MKMILITSTTSKRGWTYRHQKQRPRYFGEITPLIDTIRFIQNNADIVDRRHGETDLNSKHGVKLNKRPKILKYWISGFKDSTQKLLQRKVRSRYKRAKPKVKKLSINRRLEKLFKQYKMKNLTDDVIDPDDIFDPSLIHSDNMTQNGFISEWKTMRKSLLKMRHDMSKEQLEYTKIMKKLKGLLDEGEKINEELQRESLFKTMDAKVESDFSREIEKTRKEYERQIDEENKKRMEIEKKLIKYDASRKLNNFDKKQQKARHELAGRHLARDRLGLRLKLIDPMKEKTVEQEVKSIIQEGLGDSRLFDLDTVNKERLVAGFDEDLTNVDEMLDTILHSAPGKKARRTRNAGTNPDNGRKIMRKENHRSSQFPSKPELHNSLQTKTRRRKRNADESDDEQENDEYFTNVLQSLAIPSPADILNSNPKIPVPANYFNFKPPGTPLYDREGNVIYKHKQEVSDDMPAALSDEEEEDSHPGDEEEKALLRLRNLSRERFRHVFNGNLKPRNRLAPPPKEYKSLDIDVDSLKASIRKNEVDKNNSIRSGDKNMLAALGIDVESALQKHIKKTDTIDNESEHGGRNDKDGDSKNNNDDINVKKNNNDKDDENNNNKNKSKNSTNIENISGTHDKNVNNRYNDIITNKENNRKFNHHNGLDLENGGVEHQDFLDERDETKQKYNDRVSQIRDSHVIDKAIQRILWEDAAKHDVKRLRQDVKQIGSMLQDANRDLKMVESVQLKAVKERSRKWKEESRNDGNNFVTDMKQLKNDIVDTDKYLKQRESWN